jgi:glucokinase
MERFIGIDIGGTNVKFGVVGRDGTLFHKIKHRTSDVTQDGDFLTRFTELLEDQLYKHKDITKVGIGVPGLVSKDRTTTLRVQNIPALNNINIMKHLHDTFPGKSFWLENDANVAIIGEFYFSKKTLPDSFFMVTLGTGIGGAAILDKKLFIGGDGNGMEIGHMISGGKTYEDYLGKRGIVSSTEDTLKSSKKSKSKLEDKELDSKAVVKAALKGDEVAQKVFKKFGTVLGENIVSVIRILDTKTILLGGGVAKAYDYFKDNMYEEINNRLDGYYTDNIDIRLASLGNDAGIIGAASLGFKR